jgi:protein-tyrosine phosphatase
MNSISVQELYSEILPGLWLGGTDDFDTIDFPKDHQVLNHAREFDSVATLYAVAHPVGWGVSERRFGFPDSEIDESCVSEIHAIADWAYAEWMSGKRILIRCQAGLNRSSLCLALVLRKVGYSSKDAIALIRARRSPHALFNKSFVKYLESLDSSNVYFS